MGSREQGGYERNLVTLLAGAGVTACLRTSSFLSWESSLLYVPFPAPLRKVHSASPGSSLRPAPLSINFVFKKRIQFWKNLLFSKFREPVGLAQGLVEELCEKDFRPEAEM